MENFVTKDHDIRCRTIIIYSRFAGSLCLNLQSRHTLLEKFACFVLQRWWNFYLMIQIVTSCDEYIVKPPAARNIFHDLAKSKPCDKAIGKILLFSFSVFATESAPVGSKFWWIDVTQLLADRPPWILRTLLEDNFYLRDVSAAFTG